MEEMKSDEQLISSLNTGFGLQLAAGIQNDALYAALVDRINWLIVHDFDHLIYLLYRIDVNEAKFRQLLQNNPGKDAANMLAQMIIERQLEKIKSRRENTQRDDSISDDERW